MDEFYVRQAGNGLPLSAYAGVRYQKGYGFFGRVISKAVLPILKYLGVKAISAGKNVLKEVSSGKNIKEAAKGVLLNTIDNVADDAAENIKSFAKRKIQRGEGIKRPRLKRIVRRVRKYKKKPKKSRKKRSLLKIKRKRTKRVKNCFRLVFYNEQDSST